MACSCYSTRFNGVYSGYVITMDRQIITMLSPQALDMGKVKGGNITPETITMENVCGVLSKLSPNASRYIRLKYLLEGLHFASLAFNLNSKGVALCKRFGRRVEPQKLIETALAESIGDSICRGCNGVGYIRQEICPKCNKVGRKGWSNRKRARIMNVSSANWRRDYEPLYQAALSIFDAYESEFLDALYLSNA